MSVASSLDLDLQDLVRVFTHDDGAELLHVEADSDVWADNAGDVMGALLKLGWLPPTYTEHLQRNPETSAAFLAGLPNS